MIQSPRRIGVLARMAAAGLVCSALLLCADALGAERGAGGPTEPAGLSPATLQPFTVDWRAQGPWLADLSFLLQAPAGKDGFVRVKAGHLADGRGGRLRFWGVNVTGAAGLPSKEQAPGIASHLARRGVNCVRFHFLDRVAPSGLIAQNRNHTRALDPGQFDKLDWFIAELKKRGIYTDLNLNVARTYKTGDGVRDHEQLGFSKAVTYFDKRLLELQREYAHDLLTHTNPYTGQAYTQEPAVALIEFVNENSILESWFSGRLLGNQTNKTATTWTDIPPSYAEALTARYNAWLRTRLSPEARARLRAEAGVGPDQPIPRLTPAQFNKASAERFHREAEFYMGMERRYFEDMAAYVRQELGAKPLLVANSDHNHGKSGYPLVSTTSLLDVVDGHVYWQHPRYRTEAGRTRGFDIDNTPMVDDPLKSTVVQLARTPVLGKPYIVSEVNHPFPAEFACEGIPILAAYAAFHDWDGLFWYTLAHRDVSALDPVVGGHFDLARDPVKMTQLAPGALMFLRGDLRPAKEVVERSYTAEQVRESLRLPWSEAPLFTPGFPAGLVLQHGLRVRSFDGPAGTFTKSTATSPLRSDTGELTWEWAGRKSGLVTVDTPSSQALIGFCGSKPAQTRNMAAEIETPFAAVTLGALDGQPIDRSSRLLLTATARAANSDMRWNGRRTSLEDWGKAPTAIEVVSGKLALKDLRPAQSIKVQALDGDGRALGAASSALKTGGDWTVNLGATATTWYLLEVGL